MAPDPPELWLARHGETEWSVSGQHTGTTDIPLTDNGREQARELARSLAGVRFDLVLSSPRQRAEETARLAGLEPEPEERLTEWDYGDYEGQTTAEIQRERPASTPSSTQQPARARKQWPWPKRAIRSPSRSRRRSSRGFSLAAMSEGCSPPWHPSRHRSQPGRSRWISAVV